MQCKKDAILTAIIQAAEKEFLAVGYGKTSMRKIATQAQVTLSNIYNYFKNKDELFAAVLQPLLHKIEAGQQAMESHIHYEGNAAEDHTKMIIGIFDFIQKHRAHLHLLLHQSAGSGLQNYAFDFKKWYASITHKDMLLDAEHAGIPQITLSEFTLEFVSGIYVDLLIGLVDRPISVEEALGIGEEIMAFSHSGWKGLLSWAAQKRGETS